MKWMERSRHRERLTGTPGSSNGASSFHLWWLLPASGPLSEVSAVIEVARPPTVRHLYFWALQASFADHGRDVGAGHTGLQWHPGAPAGAVNWGGYSAADGEVLPGSGSELPPVDGPHTRHYAWSARRPYRLRVWPPAPRTWRSEITDLSSGHVTVIRDLFVPASELSSPVVWSEVFARCDDPPTEVRWSDLEAVTSTGKVVRATSVKPSYQSHADGGCGNTESRSDGQCFVQLTGLASPRQRTLEVISLAR